MVTRKYWQRKHCSRRMSLWHKVCVCVCVCVCVWYGLKHRKIHQYPPNSQQWLHCLSFCGLPSSPSEKSFRECFLSRFFLWHLVWLSVMQLRHYLFIGTLNPMLQRLTAGEPSLGKHTQPSASSWHLSYKTWRFPSFSKCVFSCFSDHPLPVCAFPTVSQYINAFAITQMCGVLCAPWNGLIMDRHKGKPRAAGNILILIKG